MADTKNEAINGAKDAAMKSVGFVLQGTKQDAAKLRSASITAAKAAVSVRKNIEQLVTQFKVYDTAIKEIRNVLNSKNTAAAQIASIRSVISSGGNQYKEEENKSEAEGKSKLSALSDAGNAVANAVPGVASFAALLALLINPETRKILTDFFTGFMEGLGLSKEGLAKVKLIFGATIGILGIYFASSVLSSVMNAFESMKRLAQVMGLLGEVQQAKGAEIDADKKKISETREKRLKRVKQLKRAKKILSTASTILKASLAAYLVGVAVDALGGTLIDVMTADDDVEMNPENIIKVILNNIVESATLGLVKGPFEVDKGASANIPPSSNNTDFVEPVAKSSASGSGPVTASSESSAPAPAAPPAPASTSTSTPMPTAAAQEAVKIEAASAEVDKAERDDAMNKSVLSILNIDNTTTIVKQAPKPKASSGPVAFSVSVGY